MRFAGEPGSAGATHSNPPLALRFAYAMDEARLVDGRRTENVEAVSLAVGIAFPMMRGREVAAARR